VLLDKSVFELVCGPVESNGNLRRVYDKSPGGW